MVTGSRARHVRRAMRCAYPMPAIATSRLERPYTKLYDSDSSLWPSCVHESMLELFRRAFGRLVRRCRLLYVFGFLLLLRLLAGGRHTSVPYFSSRASVAVCAQPCFGHPRANAQAPEPHPSPGTCTVVAV
eukprot:365611-Chlamydomonas_euryale.AAC.20